MKEKYHKEIKQALQKELGLENPMAVPKLEKIVINMGLGEATQNSKLLDPLVANLAEIAGQDRRQQLGGNLGQLDHWRWAIGDGALG